MNLTESIFGSSSTTNNNDLLFSKPIIPVPVATDESRKKRPDQPMPSRKHPPKKHQRHPNKHSTVEKLNLNIPFLINSQYLHKIITTTMNYTPMFVV